MHNNSHYEQFLSWAHIWRIVATAQSKYHKGYHPLVPDFHTVTFNDIESVKSVPAQTVAAVMIEPIQGEGGIHVVDDIPYDI